MRRHLLLIAWLLLIPGTATGCVTGDGEAVKIVEKAGYTDVKTTGLDFFECSEDDKTGKGFTAKNQKGETVEGVVCCGILKRCTIRW